MDTDTIQTGIRPTTNGHEFREGSDLTEGNEGICYSEARLRVPQINHEWTRIGTDSERDQTNHEWTRIDTNSENDPLPFQLPVFEIEDDPEPQFCNAQIVQHETALVIGDSVDHFGINHDRIENDQIGNE
jgi:hypothetical protein